LPEEGEFDLIVAPNDPFSGILEDGARAAALANARRLLAPDGLLVIEGLYVPPQEDMVASAPDGLARERRVEDGSIEQEVWRALGDHQYDVRTNGSSTRAAMEIGDTLDVRTRAAWRAWLRRNHARKEEIWLVLHTKASGRPSIAYNDAVDEALCFGWIDSIVKKVGAQSRAQRFTPRRKGSPVSEMNKARARRLVRERRMTSAGRAALGSALRRER